MCGAVVTGLELEDAWGYGSTLNQEFHLGLIKYINKIFLLCLVFSFFENFIKLCFKIIMKF